MVITPRARRFGKIFAWIFGVATFAIIVTFSAVLTIPGNGHSSGDLGETRVFFGLVLIGAMVVGAGCGLVGWLVGAVIGAATERKS